MPINYFLIVLIGFLGGVVFVFFFKRLASRYKILTRHNIPLIGGMSMGLSFVLACLFGSLLYKSLPQEVKGIISAAVVMLVFGVIDDWRELSVTAKFFVQIIAGALLILFGVKTQIVYIGNLLNMMITFVWVLAITNAFNHLDVMDGLASSSALIVSLALFIISTFNQDIKAAVLSLALTGAVLSFLIYNLPPAKIYMGNSGSHFLGFVLAAIAIVISYAPLERKVALLSPLFVLGFPVFDTAFLILIRMRKNKLPFKKSKDHLALRFLALGYSKKKALSVMSALCLFFSLCGILLVQVSNPLGLALIFSVVLVSLILTYTMARVRVDG